MTNKLKVSGIAIVEGISRNKIKYTAKELQKFAPSLIGKPILKDHSNLVNDAIGKVTHAEAINNGKAVRYEGWIQNDAQDTLGKVKNRIIESVSIGAVAGKLTKVNESDDYTVAEDLDAMELSLTPCPGVANATIKPSESNKKTSEQIKTMTKEEIQTSHNTTAEPIVRDSNGTKGAKILQYNGNIPEQYDLKVCPHCGRKFLIHKDNEEEGKDFDEGQFEQDEKAKSNTKEYTKKGEDSTPLDKDNSPNAQYSDNSAMDDEEDETPDDDLMKNVNPEYCCPYCGEEFGEDEEAEDETDEAAPKVCSGCGAKMVKENDGKMYCPNCDKEKIAALTGKKNEPLNQKDGVNSDTKMENKTEKINLDSPELQNSVHDNTQLERRIKIMEGKENKIDESVELKNKLQEAEKMIAALKESQRQDAIVAYNEKAKAKGVSAIDAGTLSMESIKALTAQLDSFKVAEKAEIKEVAKPKSTETTESVKPNANFDGYVVEHSSLGGLAFYKIR